MDERIFSYKYSGVSISKLSVFSSDFFLSFHLYFYDRTALFFFFSSRRRHTRWTGDWSSDVCSSDLGADGVGCDPDLSRRQNRQAAGERRRAPLPHDRMADVADGRRRPDDRPGASLREKQQGQSALRRGALSQGNAQALQGARHAARRARLRRRRLFHRRHRDLAVDLALRMAHRRSQAISQRAALVRDHRRAPRRAEGLQGSQGHGPDPDAEVTACPRRGGNYFPAPGMTMFCSCTSAFHFATSALMKRANSSGVCGSGSAPSLAMCSITSFSAMMPTTALLSLSTISFGVCAGASRPNQPTDA